MSSVEADIFQTFSVKVEEDGITMDNMDRFQAIPVKVEDEGGSTIDETAFKTSPVEVDGDRNTADLGGFRALHAKAEGDERIAHRTDESGSYLIKGDVEASQMVQFAEIGLDQLRGFTLNDVVSMTAMIDDDFNEWLASMGLMHGMSSVLACECGGEMKLRRSGKKCFQCTAKNCRKAHGFCAGTFFEGGRLTPKEIFRLSYHWSRGNCTYEEIKEDMRRPDGTAFSQHTLVDWMNSFRDICVQHYIDNPLMIGGPGTVVEIDETFLTRHKRTSARTTDEQAVVGGVQLGNHQCCFMVPVEQLNAQRLLTVLRANILPGTTIVSHLWDTYGALNGLPQGCQYIPVPHTKNFLIPGTDIRVSTMDCTWQKFKMKRKARFGANRTLLAAYVEEFVWKSEFGGADCMYYLWKHVSEQYSL